MHHAKRSIPAALVAAWLFAGSAAATPIDVTVEPTSDGSSVEATITESNCASFAPCYISTVLSENLDFISAMLGVGESWTFDFFDVTVGGFGTATATIEATLAFLQPEAFAAASGSGNFFTLFGIFSGGTLTWNQPSALLLSDGTALDVSFEELQTIGFGNSTTVSATVSRYQPVPEPGSLALFGIGLIMLGFFHRRSKTAAARHS